jgi:hypothetical protein
MQLSKAITGNPSSLISTHSTGQALWHLAPQATHLPAMTLALPRGFFTFTGFSIIHRSPYFKASPLTSPQPPFALYLPGEQIT